MGRRIDGRNDGMVGNWRPIRLQRIARCVEKRERAWGGLYSVFLCKNYRTVEKCVASPHGGRIMVQLSRSSSVVRTSGTCIMQTPQTGSVGQAGLDDGHGSEMNGNQRYLEAFQGG